MAQLTQFRDDIARNGTFEPKQSVVHVRHFEAAIPVGTVVALGDNIELSTFTSPQRILSVTVTLSGSLVGLVATLVTQVSRAGTPTQICNNITTTAPLKSTSEFSSANTVNVLKTLPFDAMPGDILQLNCSAAGTTTVAGTVTVDLIVASPRPTTI